LEVKGRLQIFDLGFSEGEGHNWQVVEPYQLNPNTLNSRSQNLTDSDSSVTNQANSVSSNCAVFVNYNLVVVNFDCAIAEIPFVCSNIIRVSVKSHSFGQYIWE
jgi:hypothetical protein